MQNLEQGTMVRDRWFHTYKENGDITYQGHVLDYLPPRLVLVQLFSWLDGRPTCQKLLEVTDDWSFYDTQEAMRDAWDLHLETFHHITPFKDPEVGMTEGVPWNDEGEQLLCPGGPTCKIHSPNGKLHPD